MSAEAEATDVLVKITMEGAEYFLKFAGEATEKALAIFFAGLRTLYEHQHGKQKLGGKINARSFIENFTASDIFPFSQNDFEVIKPELKRLKIPYMQYKQTKDMKESGQIEISVRKEDADKFIRVCEQHGLATVSPYNTSVQELSEERWQEEMVNGVAENVEVKVGDDGVSIQNNRNFMPASSDHSSQSEPNSDDLVEGFTFDETKSLSENLEKATIVSKYDNGTLIPISANKDTLFMGEVDDNVLLIIPGTQGAERLVVPKSDIVNMNADNGQSIRADLRHNHKYKIVDNSGKELRFSSGDEIKASGKWAKVADKVHSLKKPSIPKPDVIKKGVK